jgi:4-hydroxy-4-methyl-2-oxoglutarate aldolase
MEMAHPTVLSFGDLEKLKEFDSCRVSNAIKRLNVRLRNEGFLSGVARCRFPKFPPLAGYAATARIRTASAPMSHRCYYDRMDWWNYVASLPEPRVMVLQDADHNAGLGAFVGEIHATVGVELGEPVVIDSRKIASGDLLHGDRYGVVSIPLPIAAKIPLSLQELPERIRNMNIGCAAAGQGAR